MVGVVGSQGILHLVTARFFVLLGHFVATCSLFFVKLVPIQIALDPDDSLETRLFQYHYTNTCYMGHSKVATILVDHKPVYSVLLSVPWIQAVLLCAMCLYIVLSNRRFTALLAFALVGMFIEALGLLSGYTLHQKSANLVSALAHFAGFACTISMVLNGWSVHVYPPIFSLCSVLPAGFDVLWWAWQTCGGKFRRPDLGTFGHRCC